MIHLYRCYPPDILRVDISDLSGSNQSPRACTRSYGTEREILHLTLNKQQLTHLPWEATGRAQWSFRLLLAFHVQFEVQELTISATIWSSNRH